MTQSLGEDHARGPLDELVEHVREAVVDWSIERLDDLTVVVVRYDGPS